MPSTLTERIASREDWIGSAAAAWTSDVGAVDERPRVALGADVAAHLLDPALELAVVERRDVERAHGAAVGEHAPREVQPEEAGPAGDRDQRHIARQVTGSTPARTPAAGSTGGRPRVHEHRGERAAR